MLACLLLLALLVKWPTSASAQLTISIEDYAVAPVSGSVGGSGNAAYLARINSLEDDPMGNNRFFVNDLNGKLSLLDKSTKQFTTYLDFNGRGSATGLYDKFVFASGYANGLVTFEFDPEYAVPDSSGYGRFYTVHIEEPNASGSLVPNNSAFPGLNTTGYTASTAVSAPLFNMASGNRRHSVLVEWTDSNPGDSIFEGSARELLRLEELGNVHPIGDLIFNPTAQPGDDDWRVMYIASGDGISGEQTGSLAGAKTTPQRLDTLNGKVLRIVPDLSSHVDSSTVATNGRYRIPDSNPFADLVGAKGEVWANGFRNPHRLSWDVDPANPVSNHLIVNDIGLNTWEEVNLVHAGANYGYPLREGNQSLSSSNVIGPIPANDTIPVRIDATTTSGTITPTYPVVQYGHNADVNPPFEGDSITSGFVYRGSRIPALYGQYVFGDITTGQLFYSDFAEMLSADDGDPTTMAEIHTLSILWDNPNDAPDQGLESYSTMFPIVKDTYHARGGLAVSLPGAAPITNGPPYGGGRADIRLQVDAAGELYILSKSDGMIRAIVGPVPSPGDFNGDGTVDQQDYQLWEFTFGSTTGGDLRADGNHDGVVDAADYTIWRDYSSGDMLTGTSSQVPEPAGWCAAVSLLIINSLRRPQRQSASWLTVRQRVIRFSR